MAYKGYCLVSGALFSLVAFAHLTRVVFGWPVAVGDMMIPMGISWLGLIVTAALASWAFRLSRGAGGG